MAREYFSLQRQEHGKGCCNKSSPCVACLLFLLIALIIAAIVTGFIFLIMSQTGHAPKVETTCGRVEGAFCAHSGAFIFKGIPYANPPVGDKRWKFAEMLEPLEEGGDVCWEGTYLAKGKKDTCVQVDYTSENGTVSGAEDCLYLNVYTPEIYERPDTKKEENATSKFPVMVFVHGEKAADPKYMPDGKMAEDMELVIVTPQYRVGALGFLVLDQEGINEGNYGLSDLVQALVWVKDNIEAFGGDPKDVTIVGQGTGASCVMSLLASPQAKDLFHRTWIMSGGGVPTTSLGKAQDANAFILDATNCEDAKCLRNVSAEEITSKVHAGWMKEDLNDLPQFGVFPFPRIVSDDHKYLIHTVPRSVEALTGSDVPILIGSAAHSVDDNPGPGEALKSMTKDDYMKYLDEHITQQEADKVLPFYNFTSDKDSEYKLTKLISDSRYTCGHEKVAGKAAEHLTSPVYRYILRGYLSGEVNAFGNSYPARYAFGGWDLYALLGKVDQDRPAGATEADDKFKEVIREMALSFIKESGPKKPEGWKEYPEGLALISDHIAVVDSQNRKDICKYWDENLGPYQANY